jgi:methylated-DNA-[protein]-cysteine S-methyltransferase
MTVVVPLASPGKRDVSATQSIARTFKDSSTPHSCMDDSGIYAREFDRLDTAVQVGLASGRVISVSFPDSVPGDADTDHALLDRIEAYLAGEADQFDDVTVALTVPTETRRVLDAVRKIPYGERISLNRLVRLAGFDDEDASDVETVESALGSNPVPLFVPDHRVTGPGATPDAVASRLRAVEESG